MLFQKVVSEATTDSLGAPHASLPQRVGATSLAAVDELGHADSGAGLK